MSKLPGRALAACLILIVATGAGLLAFVATAGLTAPRPGDGGVWSADAAAPARYVRRIEGPYRAEAVRVVDGDTFEARLRIWFNQDVTILVRLEGVDAPELRGRCEQERRLALESRDALAAILASGEVFVRDLHADKYNGRAVARAIVTDRAGAFNDDVGALLLAGGYARAYAGRARASWCGPAAVLAAGERAR
jgi:micrococcal nuclease